MRKYSEKNNIESRNNKKANSEELALTKTLTLQKNVKKALMNRLLLQDWCYPLGKHQRHVLTLGLR